jgi:hypothetical protein
MTTARKRTATRPGVPLLRMLATRRTLCSARRKTSSLFCPVSNCTTLYANSEAVGKATGSQREANQRPTVGGGTESKRRTESGRCRRRHFAPDGAFTARCYLRSLLLAQREYIDQVQRKRGIICPWVFHRNGEQIQVFRRNWKTACKNAGCAGRTLTTSAAQPCATWCAPAFRNGWP